MGSCFCLCPLPLQPPPRAQQLVLTAYLISRASQPLGPNGEQFPTGTGKKGSFPPPKAAFPSLPPLFHRPASPYTVEPSGLEPEAPPWGRERCALRKDEARRGASAPAAGREGGQAISYKVLVRPQALPSGSHLGQSVPAVRSQLPGGGRAQGLTPR